MTEVQELEKKIDEIKGKLKEFEVEVNEIYGRQEIIRKELIELQKQYVIVSGVISEAEWRMEFTVSSRERLSLYSDTRKHPKFSKILQSNYHCDLKFEDGVTLIFSDDDIYFQFDSLGRGLDFIFKWSIRTNINSLIKEMEAQEKRMRDVGEFIKLYEERMGERKTPPPIS
jgi:chromosome segregation ATPase